MITRLTEQKLKCDVKDCKNFADYALPSKGRVGKFFLCKHCLEKIAQEVAKAHTPKSPKNTIKKIIESKEEVNC